MMKIRILGLILLCQGCFTSNDDYIDNPSLKTHDLSWEITQHDDTTIYLSDIDSLKSPFVLLTNRNQAFRCYLNNRLLDEVSMDELTSNDLYQNKSGVGIYSQWSKRYTWFNDIPLGKHQIRIEAWGNNIKTTAPVLASEKGTKEFISLKADTVFEKSNKLPVLMIETHHKPILDDPKIEANLNVINVGNKLNDVESKFAIALERRGNTSQFFAKKAYAINMLEANKGLLQLPKASKYILYAPYADKSMLRNALAYEISAAMDVKSVPFQYCELVVNGDYQGVYIVMNRMNDLHALNMDTSSYLIKMDRGNSKCLFGSIPNTFPKKRKTRIEILDAESLTKVDSTLIMSSIEDFEKAIDHYDLSDNQFTNHIDLNSFVDYFIINEWAKNIDAYRLSAYFYYDKKEKKWFAGPIWDYNFAFGLVDYENGFSPEGFVYTAYAEIPFWWEKLAFNTTFQKQVHLRWEELKNGVLSAKSVEKRLNTLLDDQKAIERNFMRWMLLGLKEMWPNYFMGKTHLEEKQYLVQWVEERNEWLDKSWFVNEHEVLETLEETKNEIRKDEKWFEDIQLKAKRNNISTEEQLEKDAWWKVYHH